MTGFLTTDPTGEGNFGAGFLSKGRGERSNNIVINALLVVA